MKYNVKETRFISQSGEPVSVDGELATILTNSRYGSLFDVADSADTTVTKRVSYLLWRCNTQ